MRRHRAADSHKVLCSGRKISPWHHELLECSRRWSTYCESHGVQVVQAWRSITDDKRPGRPRKSGSELTGSVLRVLNEDRRLAVRDIASDFSISVSTAHDIMTNELGSRGYVRDGFRDCFHSTKNSDELKHRVRFYDDGGVRGAGSWTESLQQTKLGYISITQKQNSSPACGKGKALLPERKQKC